MSSTIYFGRKSLISGLFTLALVFFGSTFRASALEPVHWTAEMTDVSNGKATLTVTGVIDEGWHIYGFEMPDLGADAGVPDPTSLTLTLSDGITADGEMKKDGNTQEHFDDMMELNLPWLFGPVTFTQTLNISDGATGPVSGVVRYMACTEQSCTPPGKFEFSIPLGGAAPAGNTEVVAPVQTAAAPASVQPVENELWAPVEVTAESTSQSYWSILIFGFLGGLVALMTPCVWPMIPMTVSFFLKKNKSRRRSIIDAVLYSASIIIIFLALGILLTVIFGPGKLNEIATGALFNLIFFALLVFFAISFFGAFEIKLPSKWSNAADARADSTTGVLSIFFMAFTLVLVSFSCTGPIIGTLLVEAFSDGSNLMGPLLGMGGFALGLALPFGLFAFFPSMLKELPRSGSWLNTIKVVLGFIELILSLKFLSVADLAYGWHILDREVFISIWIVLFVLLGVYLLGKLRFSHDDPSEHTSVSGFFMAVASFAFAVYLIPGLWGAPLKAISAFAPPLYTQDFNLYGGTFEEFDDYDRGMAYAIEHDKPVLVDFSGYACVNCRKMEGAVFDTPTVRGIIEKDYVMIKLMVDDKAALPQPMTVTEEGRTVTLETVGEKWAYLQRHKFGINSQPYYVLLDNKGKVLNAPRVYDENVDDFVAWLEDGIEKYKAQ